MKCPFCSETETHVLESRSAKDGKSLRRRRKCSQCNKRFTTHEEVDETLLWVIKKDGRREPFEKEKIKRGVLRALEKRPATMQDVSKLLADIEKELLKKSSAEISSRTVGGIVVRKLKKVDKVAWLRFASVYMEFEDLDDFLEAVKQTR